MSHSLFEFAHTQDMWLLREGYLITFAIAGYCVKSRMLGAALATSDIAAGARSLFARARAGVAVIQNYADRAIPESW